MTIADDLRPRDTLTVETSGKSKSRTNGRVSWWTPAIGIHGETRIVPDQRTPTVCLSSIVFFLFYTGYFCVYLFLFFPLSNFLQRDFFHIFRVQSITSWYTRYLDTVHQLHYVCIWWSCVCWILLIRCEWRSTDTIHIVHCCFVVLYEKYKM